MRKKRGKKEKIIIIINKFYEINEFYYKIGHMHLFGQAS